MPGPIFYAAAQDRSVKNKINGYVPSTFLMRKGAYVVDPIPGASQKASLFFDSSGGNETDGRIANPNNYIVVPANYSEWHARNFGAALAGTWHTKGLVSMLEQVESAFRQGGSDDLQRNPRWGIPPNSFVRAYTSAASDHFGYVTAAAGMPRILAEIGGGLHNLDSWAGQKADSWLNGTRIAHPIDISGKFGLSKMNEANLVHGYAAGLAGRRPPAPFNDYGYGVQRQRTPGQIGDGNGIAPLPATLAGINPDEPAPPTWPPGQNRPIRYVSAQRVRY